MPLREFKCPNFKIGGKFAFLLEHPVDAIERIQMPQF
jgi:hypothetical protein